MGFTPRKGQRVLFKLAADKAENVKALGAHVTPGGFFHGVYVAQATEPKTLVRHPDGSQTEAGGEVVPERIMLCDANDENVPYLQRDASGTRIANVYFAPEAVLELQPCLAHADLPPGAVVDPLYKFVA